MCLCAWVNKGVWGGLLYRVKLTLGLLGIFSISHIFLFLMCVGLAKVEILTQNISHVPTHHTPQSDMSHMNGYTLILIKILINVSNATCHHTQTLLVHLKCDKSKSQL